MPRKKPFSGKQKKKQLHQKRLRKQHHHGKTEDSVKYQSGTSTSESEDCEEEEEENESSPKVHEGFQDKVSKLRVEKIHRQPIPPHRVGQHDPNKYNLQFKTEAEEDVLKRKLDAKRIPLVALDEEARESAVQDFYPPGWVLDIPKRPSWDYSTSKNELEQAEKKYFDRYLLSLHSLHEIERLSHFEHNLETWRQLWRVLERSNVVCFIVDVRFAPIHFHPKVHKHVVEELGKQFVLVLNKVDLVPPDVVVAWKHYFLSEFPHLHVVCFTSHPDPETSLDEQQKVSLKFQRRRKVLTAVGPFQLFQVVSSLYSGKEVDFSGWQDHLEEKGVAGGVTDVAKTTATKLESAERVSRPADVLTIGMIGYPNAGKSSIINGILGKKAVSVSRTPGHTKHFQTIYLTDSIVLCDCPGLVFPVAVDRRLQIISGLYPISQVREPYSVVGYLAERVPIVNLLKLVNPNSPSERQDLTVEWTPWDVCDAWAEKRGYYTAKAARLDTYRAANSLLRLACDGRIQFYLVPKGFYKERDKWSSHPEMIEIIDLQKKGLVGKVDALALSSCSSSSCEDGKEEDEITLFKDKTNPFSVLS